MHIMLNRDIYGGMKSMVMMGCGKIATGGGGSVTPLVSCWGGLYMVLLVVAYMFDLAFECFNTPGLGLLG